MAYFISPARLARYFYHDCERFLRYDASPKGEPGVPRRDRSRSPVTRSLLEAGFAWEEEVLRHLGRRALVPPGGGAPRDRAWSVQDTLDKLPKLRTGQALYQGQLPIPPSFYQRYGLDPKLLCFPDCKPDLVLKTEQGQLRVIDVKASDELKSSHRIQVGLYVLILREHFPETIDLQTGGIWLSQQSSPTDFELRHTLPVLETFLRDRLTSIFRAELEEIPWHVLYRCEWCDYFEHCRKEAQETSSVSLLPYLSHGARAFLREEGVNRLSELADYLKRSPERIDLCGSLRGRAHRLGHQVRALLGQELQEHGGASLALPSGESQRIFLTLQKEPVSGAIYAAALLRFPRWEWAHREGWQLCARSFEETQDVRRGLVSELHRRLAEVDAHNRAHSEWKEQLTLQCYVFDAHERDLLEDLLFEALEDPESSEQALQLLFHFQSEELARWDEHPRTEIPYPVVALTEAIRDLVAVPQPLTLTLEETLEWLKTWEGYSYQTPPYLRFELSNALRQDAVLKTWSGEKDHSGFVQDTLRRRLEACAVLLDGLRRRLRHRLFAWPPRFQFVDSEPFEHPELSRLAFVVRYECFLGALKTRRRRSAPRAEREQQSLSIPLQCLDDRRWKVLSTVDSSAVTTSVMPDRLLVPEGEEGEKAQMAYDDFRNRATYYAPGKTPVRLAKLLDFTARPEDGTIKELELKVISASIQPELAPGERAVLHPRFQDSNTDKILACLRELDTEPKSHFLRLLRGELQGKLPTLPCARGLALTPSQSQALEHLRRHRLTLIWGPPGTGKTYFLATALKGLLQANPGLRVGVTAFTNAAIDNLVRKLPDARRIVYEPVEPHQVTHSEATSLPGVVGGTVYGLQKAGREVDLMIVDEGSQLKLGEAALALRWLSPQGRLVVAGDHLQLPPIIQGRYPEENRLHDSVFAYLQERHPACQLTENWRMNDTLCAFPAEALYGSDYRPVDGRARLKLKGKSSDALCEWLLDPEFPLALCVLENVRATVENRVEAELVARLAADLRRRGPWRDDAVFWRQGLFIVSPHHLQIRAIRQALARLREWEASAFVDTVDKMQGQESAAVLVSYGVSDPETALGEADFLYSLNRLNVAITRAREKCVVFLPRPLLEPSFDLLSNQRAAEGLGFMHALLEFCRAGESRREALEDGATLAMYRTRVGT